MRSFGAASIVLNGPTSLSFTIDNPNDFRALTGVGFTDTLPAGLVVSTPNGLTGSCGGGTARAGVTVTAGGPATPTSVPALRPWALALLGLLLIVTGGIALRHKIG